MTKFKAITGVCRINNKRNTLVGQYESVSCCGDPKTHYILVGFEYNEMCSDCELENDEREKQCRLYKNAKLSQE